MDDPFEPRELSLEGKQLVNKLWRNNMEMRQLMETYPYTKIHLLINTKLKRWLNERSIRYVYGYVDSKGYIIFEKNEDALIFSMANVASDKVVQLHLVGTEES